MPAATRATNPEKISAAKRRMASAEARRRAFGSGLSDALAAHSLTQADLAELMSTTQSTVSGWINARSEPAAETVFAVEEAMGLSPGYLSRLLGYLPLTAVGARPDVEATIANTDEVDDLSKRMMLTVWRTLVEKHQTYLTAVNGGASRRTRSKTTTTKASAPSPTARSRKAH